MNGAYTSELGKYLKSTGPGYDLLPPPRKGDARYLENDPMRHPLRMRIGVVMVTNESFVTEVE